MKCKKILILFIIIFLVYILLPDLELFTTKTLKNKQWDAVKLAECSAEAHLITDDIKDQMGLSNTLGLDNFPNKKDIFYNIGNQKLNNDLEIQPKCLCGDKLKCLYLPACNSNYTDNCGKSVNREYVLKKVCEVNKDIQNKLWNKDCSGSKLILKTPKVTGNFNGWFYLPSHKLSEVESIYRKLSDYKCTSPLTYPMKNKKVADVQLLNCSDLGNKLHIGSSLKNEQYLKSLNGKFKLLFKEGNLCIMKNNKQVHCINDKINYKNKTQMQLNFQTDSNLCINSGPCNSSGVCTGKNLWSLGNKYWQTTINEIWKKYKGNVPSFLNINVFIKNDGNVLINKNNIILWALFDTFNGKNWGAKPAWAEGGKLSNATS